MKKVCWLSAGVSSFIAGILADNVDEYIYIDVPDVYEARAKMEEDIGATCIKGISLRQLQPGQGKNKVIVPDCSLVCDDMFGGNYNG